MNNYKYSSTMIKKTEPKEQTYVQWIVAILANSTLLTYGLQSGWISPMTKVLQSELSPVGRLSDNELSWVASTMALSAVFGVPIYTYIADRFGRKIGIILIAAPQTICWIIKLYTTSTTGLIIARICCGIPAGGCFHLIPMYVKEISQDQIRGLLGSLLILMQNIGILSMYAIGSHLGYKTVLWIVVGIPLVTVLLMLKAPESPAFLVKVGKIKEATMTVAFLRGLSVDDTAVLNEVSYMTNDDQYYKSLPDISIVTILKNKAWRRAFTLVLSMLSIASINGNFAILTYASSILATSGVTFSPDLQALSFPAIMIVGSCLSMSCVERVGRKIILATAHLVTVVSLVCLATTQLLQHQGISGPGWLPVVAIVTSLCAYSAGVSPMPYIMMSEIFNFQIRAKAIGFILTYCWLLAFFQLAAFGSLSAAIGSYGAFYCFAAVNLIGALFAALAMPETRGKTIDQIEMVLRGK